MQHLILALALAACLAATEPAADKVISSPEIYEAKANNSTQIVHTSFEITNGYATTARVVNVTPSCDCVRVMPFKHEIAPGGKVEVQADVEIKNRDGALSKDIVLDLAGVPQKQLTLNIHIVRQ